MRYFDEIAKKAQELSKKNGRAEGSVIAIWLKAERIVMAQQVEQEENVGKRIYNKTFISYH
jgi:hypothetical protein